VTAEVRWKTGTRHAAGAVVRFGEGEHAAEVEYAPEFEFFMLGLGYGHPKWGHGLNHGAAAVEREDLRLADVDVRQPQHLHVQALSRVTYRSGGEEVVGRGVLEQLAIGPHAPSGFKSLLDMAE
jgi:hypothetical protein